MSKRPIISEELGKPSDFFSQAVEVPTPGRLLFVSGMVARRADGSLVGPGDIAAQTRQVCENLKAALVAAGGTLDDVCRIDVFVRNIEHRETIYQVRSDYFKPPLPASTMVEVPKFVNPGYLIEINAIAVLAASRD